MRRFALAAAITLIGLAANNSDVWALPSADVFGPVPSSKQPAAPVAASDPITAHTRAPLSADAAALVIGNNRFALDMYRSLASGENADKNVLASPFSMSAALAMTYAGARGRTAEQMADVLGFTLPGDRLHAAFGELLDDLTAPRDGYQLSIANRLFGQAGYPFENPFLNTTAQNYSAPLQALDFRNQPEGARNTINQWVDGQTNNKIRGLMPQGSITPDMRLVLANAIYFNGSWKHKFDADATRSELFFGGAGRPSQASMMSQQHSFLYSEQSNYQMLEMPYAGDDLSMVVILPMERDGLSAVENSLSADGLQESLAALRSTLVNVRLPKFKFDSFFKLGDALADMGMTDAFDPDLANFSGIVDPRTDHLAIGTALHKAFIDVNEEGTEAAAATAIGVITTTCYMCGTPAPENFVADHPFLFALRDLHSGSLLFLGRVTDPGQLALGTAVPTPEPVSIALLIIGAIFLLPRRGKVR